ncbi:hypothetical protein LTR28_003912 [Elasticomyces elasticus]|nr:hypothetical protein LTR28_003912 [Elasticomyces elasticus]
MDSDALFTANAELDKKGLRTETTSQSSRSSRTGEYAVLAARGGMDTNETSGLNEEQPLLSEEAPLLANGGAGGGGRTTWPGYQPFEHIVWWRRPSIYWMLAPFFLSTLAFGGIIVPKLNLILTLICREYISDRRAADPGFTMVPVVFGSENPQCRIPEVQSRVAQFTLYGNLIGGLLSAVTSPKLGALSDRYGRTRVIALTSMGTLVGEVITICAATYPETFAVNWILVGFAFDGLCGSFIAAMALANAYATDCTPPSERSVAFGYFHGCLFTGIAIGPLISGYIVKMSGTVLSVFYIALGVHCFFILFAGTVIPESLSPERQRVAREKHRSEKEASGPAADWINQIRSINLLEPLKVLYPRGEGSSPALRRNLVLLAAVDTIVFGVAMGSMTVIVIYANYEFGWTTFQSSIFLSTVNVCRVTCLIVVLPLVTRFVRAKTDPNDHVSRGALRFDLNVIRTAVFFDTVGYLGYTLARTGALMTVSGALAAVGGIGSPTLQAVLTKHVPADRTGQLLGASGLLHALARVVAPTIFNGIYSVTVGKFTQTVFVCLTATFGVAFALSWFLKPGSMSLLS